MATKQTPLLSLGKLLVWLCSFLPSSHRFRLSLVTKRFKNGCCLFLWNNELTTPTRLPICVSFNSCGTHLSSFFTCLVWFIWHCFFCYLLCIILNALNIFSDIPAIINFATRKISIWNFMNQLSQYIISLYFQFQLVHLFVIWDGIMWN